MLALLRSIFVVAALAAVLIQGIATPAAQATTSGTGISARGNWTPPTGSGAAIAERQAGLQRRLGSPVRAGHDGDQQKPRATEGTEGTALLAGRAREHEELRPGQGRRLHRHVHAVRVDAIDERALPDADLPERQIHRVPLRGQHLVPRRPVQERASQGDRSDVVRQFDRQMGRRHAHRGHDRIQRVHAPRHRGPSA